jgi:hypothetical protein
MFEGINIVLARVGDIVLLNIEVITFFFAGCVEDEEMGEALSYGVPLGDAS